MTIARLLLNGRFLSRPMTGVDRSAMELVRAMLRIQANGNCAPFVLDVAVPRDAPSDANIREMLGLPPSSRIMRSILSGYVWEQIALSGIEPELTLLNLCNTGPILRKNQLVLLHDAQVFDVPESYSFTFRCIYRIIQPILARTTHYLATVSRSSRDRLQQNNIGRSREIEVVHNGMDHLQAIIPDKTILNRHGLKSGEYFLAFHSAAPHKNVDTVVRANGIRRRHEKPLVLAGARGKVEFDAEVGESIICLGRISDEELVALYSNACAFLLPSNTEGFGLTAGEAMAAGCPVITSTGGALMEVYSGAAVFVDPDDVTGWANALDEMAANPRHRNLWAETGRNHTERFTWDASARVLMQIVGIETSETSLKPAPAESNSAKAESVETVIFNANDGPHLGNGASNGIISGGLAACR